MPRVARRSRARSSDTPRRWSSSCASLRARVARSHGSLVTARIACDDPPRAGANRSRPPPAPTPWASRTNNTMSTIQLDLLRDRYQAAKARALDLDMTRGKPCAEQLDLSLPMLDGLSHADYRAVDGTDTRNYGLVDGLPEAKRFFADILEVAPAQVIVGDNASLSLMYDVISEAFHHGVPGSARPWGREASVKILCPSPGYDRHFALCEFLGAQTVAVGLGDGGPDLEEVSRLVADDPSVKAIFCVPRYSNPTGITYDAESVRGLARMKTAAPDFRIIWDNAYAVHHLYPDPEPLANMAEECNAAGNPDRPFLVTSTSKITFAGAGMSAIAASD